jgi:hypothetical protein
MSDVIIANILRFLGLFLVQVLILVNVEINSSYVNLYIYPLFLLLLPIRLQKVALLAIAFLVGISIDMFYDSAGVHAAASVFTAYFRSVVLLIIEPRGGYDASHKPTKAQYGAAWFFQYAGILLFIHLFSVFALEAFSFASIGVLLLKTILSFLLSMLLIVIYTYLFNPKR